MAFMTVVLALFLLGIVLVVGGVVLVVRGVVDIRRRLPGWGLVGGGLVLVLIPVGVLIAAEFGAFGVRH